MLRGAPCGATWNAAYRMIGKQAEEAALQIGLEVQFLCSADPSAWDPIGGQSPVHLAGKVHQTAMQLALRHEGNGLE